MNLFNSSPSDRLAQTAAGVTGAGPDDGRRLPARVLLIAPGLDPSSGGIEGVGFSIGRLLADRAASGEIRCHALDLHGDPRKPRTSDGPGGMTVRAFGSSRGRFSAAALAAMATWADLVIFTHVGLASLLLLLPRPLRPRSTVFLHGIEVWTTLSYRKRRALEQADLVVANTQFTADRAQQFNPGLRPIRVCHLGIPDQAAEANQPQPPADSGSQDILIVGCMSYQERYKGHTELIAALPAVLEQAPAARLVVVGTGADRAYYESQASSAGVAPHVLFTGYLPATVLWHTYRHSALLAMPSRAEGFGLVYLEAMRAGLPCVASTADAASVIVLDEQTGLLVDPDNRGQLADALIRLLRDRELRDRLGAAGRRRFEEHFTEGHFHARFWPLILSTLPSRCQTKQG